MKMKKLYEVEIKSMAIIREGKNKSFITYFRGGTHEQIISNLKILYPQFMKPEDQPVVNITRIKEKEYRRRKKENIIRQKQVALTHKDYVMKVEDYETVGN